MNIEFREFNPFDLWIWLELETVPSPREQQYIEEVFDSWFYLGKLGAFNAENLQVQDMGIDISYMEYGQKSDNLALMSPMHNMGEFQYNGLWGRCWFDLGMSDLIAIDILINALQQIDREYVTIQRLIVGGENSDWPVDDRTQESFAEN
ncbi:DUF3531 family protein [Gloeocapsa sp. PCC 73106]|uniref:DUF3531 family protein n=1 Tax=Gloeocapsa sp. PCC 73106 TaxID=102232 RepID=UPI0002ABC494|nr:DUF3531 family protein [Gloeocapsa sp. PCC 73106]ELR98735.1 Protein of unknown function (DUF3531) [Gloeocapsa sp. PCC 73106]